MSNKDSYALYQWLLPIAAVLIVGGVLASSGALTVVRPLTLIAITGYCLLWLAILNFVDPPERYLDYLRSPSMSFSRELIQSARHHLVYLIAIVPFAPLGWSDTGRDLSFFCATSILAWLSISLGMAVLRTKAFRKP